MRRRAKEGDELHVLAYGLDEGGEELTFGEAVHNVGLAHVCVSNQYQLDRFCLCR
eukprot:m.181894 g.181894  ORF g.181894 m.181894 type:complete len:55 (-) comp16635_c0_seq5:214-378(-)